MHFIVGVDFDNTIINYDDVMHRTAVRKGFIPDKAPKSKRSIRDQIRQLPDGEKKWQELQAHVYGRAMDEGKLIEGVKGFFDLCREKGIKTYIVSHKTKFAGPDEKGVDLHQPALAWMRSQGFFDKGGLGLSLSDVYFEGTRKAKVQRVQALGCTHFIDDLEETFLEASFPSGVMKILYCPDQGRVQSGDIKVSRSWEEIREYFAGNYPLGTKL